MANEKKVVKFGLKNLHYAMIDEDTGEYGTPVRVPGAVNINVTAEGDSNTFNADDGAFFVSNANNGYTGSIEIASMPDQMKIDLLGCVKDGNGMILEPTDAIAKSAALMFEVSSNLEPQRFLFYSVTLSRPAIEANTTSDSIEPDTTTLDFTAVAKEFEYGAESRPFVKGHATKGTATDDAYNNFYTKVQLPTAVAV